MFACYIAVSPYDIGTSFAAACNLHVERATIVSVLVSLQVQLNGRGALSTKLYFAPRANIKQRKQPCDTSLQPHVKRATKAKYN